MAMAKVKHVTKRAEMKTTAGELVALVEAATVEVGMARVEVEMATLSRTAVAWAATKETMMAEMTREVKGMEVRMAAE